MRLIQINDINVQRKWLNKFLRAYHGEQVNTSAFSVDSRDTYVVGYANHRDVGYISLRNLQGMAAEVSPTGKVLKCAFVEQNRRGNGMLRQMIIAAVEQHEIKMIEIEFDRFQRNLSYYADLGFTEFESEPGKTLGFCYSAEFGIALRRARMAKFAVAANDNKRRVLPMPYAA